MDVREESQSKARRLYVFLALIAIAVAAIFGFSLASGDAEPKTTTQPRYQAPQSPFTNRPAQPGF